MNINKNKIRELVYGKISTEELKSIAFDKKKDIYSNILTFSPKVFIPLTTLCQDHCSYCTFVKTPSGFKVTAPEGYVSVDRMSNKAFKIVDRLEFSKNNFTVAKDWIK